MTPISPARLPFDIVGFDLDGTLLDTSADLTAAVNHALALVGRPPLTDDQVRPSLGLGAKTILIQALDDSGGIPPDDFRPLYKQMLRFYEANVSVHSRPYDGAIATLDRLAAMGLKTAIVTNKFESLAVKALTDLGLIDRFVTVIGGDTLGTANAKPSAAPIHAMITRCGGGRAVFVGDSVYDMMAARNAGIPCVAAAYGFLIGPVDEMGADAVIDHLDDLVPTLERLPG